MLFAKLKQTPQNAIVRNNNFIVRKTLQTDFKLHRRKQQSKLLILQFVIKLRTIIL